MNKIKIICDSTCDLSPELIEKYDIKIVPLHVYFPSENVDYLDGQTLDVETLYKKVNELGETPKTAARNVAELISDFKPYIEDGYDILFTGIGSGLSSTYQNATVAAQSFPEGRIEVIDSQNLSTGTGLLAVKMGELIKEGLDVHQIAEKVRALVPNVSSKFCIDTLDYLYKGGRCTGMQRLLTQVFRIHLVAKVYQNELKPYKKIPGKYVKAVDAQIKEFMDDLPNIDKSCVFITDSGYMEGLDMYIHEKIKDYIPEENIHHTRAGCVVSSHCGPKTIGILYIMDKPCSFN